LELKENISCELFCQLDLIGSDYIWKIILSGSEDMANRAIAFLRTICTALGPNLLPQQREVHDDFLSSCCDRLKTSYDTILVLEKDKDSTNRVRQEVTRACRVLRVLFEYIVECDSEYGEERAFIPMYR
jgi:ubiquitin carboxyl-terminal hydrolase 9/24